MQHAGNHIAQQEHQHKDEDTQPDVQPVEGGQLKMADLFALDNGVGDTKVRQRIGGAIITSETVSRPNWWLSIMRASTVIRTVPRPMMTMVAMADHFAPLMVFLVSSS